MKLREILLFGVAATSLVLGASFATADETAPAPLPAGGPAAQSEAGITTGEVIEVGGILVAVSIAGLVALNSDDDSPPATTTNTP